MYGMFLIMKYLKHSFSTTLNGSKSRQHHKLFTVQFMGRSRPTRLTRWVCFEIVCHGINCIIFNIFQPMLDNKMTNQIIRRRSDFVTLYGTYMWFVWLLYVVQAQTAVGRSKARYQSLSQHHRLRDGVFQNRPTAKHLISHFHVNLWEINFRIPLRSRN